MQKSFLQVYSDAFHRIPGWFTYDAALMFMAYNQLIAEDGISGDTLEIGVYYGLSAIAVATLRGPGRRMYAVDLFEELGPNEAYGVGRTYRERFEEHMLSFFGKLDFLSPITSASGKLKSSEFVPAFSFCHVDGGHSPRETFADLKFASDILMPGGLLALDDYFNPQHSGVCEGALEFRRRHEGVLRPVAIGYNKVLFQKLPAGRDLNAKFSRAFPAVERMPAADIWDAPVYLFGKPMRGYFDLNASKPERLVPFGAAGVVPKYVEANGMNVQNVVREIHARIEKEDGVESLPVRESAELTALRDAFGRLYQARNAVGRMPPGPNTIRAKLGKHLIRAVQRSLFWYTPQIVSFQNEASNALDCVCNLIAWQMERTAALEKDARKHSGELSAHSGELSELSGELSKLSLQLPLVRTTPAAVERIRDHEPDQEYARPLPNAFQFALQDRFRGSERETLEKLRPYLSEVETWKDSLPRAPWLDIACGRGEWLEAVGNTGYGVIGIDSNPVAVAHCRVKGLNAEETDALGYLRSLKSESLAVVTAFHAVEHWPMSYVLELMQEAVRVLQPDGLMIIETPNPANLLMGSFNFWKDPTHRRPIPPALLEFVYEYFGLRVVKRLDLNRSPQEERLPYDEIGVVHRLNESLYGPQDYGLIGRR
jgi:SAM-dependent methyltransferase/predicted O-methyltransferase YrrM